LLCFCFIAQVASTRLGSEKKTATAGQAAASAKAEAHASTASMKKGKIVSGQGKTKK
jgi:hypothetical protein